MKEIWKDIKGYEGLYQVSNLGRVKSILTGRLMKPVKLNTGYMIFGLTKEKKCKRLTVHRLVAKQFIENPKNKKQVNHIDGDKINNIVSNLEWNTGSENMKHSYRTLNRIPAMLGRKGKLCSRSKAIASFSLTGKILRKYDSAKDVQKDGFNEDLVSLCARGKQDYHKKLIWKYT